MPYFKNPEDDPYIDEFSLAIIQQDARRRAAVIAKRNLAISAGHPANVRKAQRTEKISKGYRERASKGTPYGRWGESDVDRALLAMAAGEWLAHSDIGKRIGLTVQRVQWLMMKFRKEGWAVRADNEEYAGKPSPALKVKEQPKFLWQISSEGLQAAEKVRALMGVAKPDVLAATASRWAGKRRSKR